MLKLLIATISISSFCLACTNSKSDKKLSIPQIAKSYKDFTRMTKKPTPVNPTLAMLCRGLSKEEIESIKKEKGPHALTYIHMYMNDLAAKAFTKEPYKFPVGSIIVKDKSGDDDGVGGMVKRKPGYDSKHGDWEYFYFTKPDKIKSGKIQSCVKCHSLRSNTDYVYGDWSKRKN